MKNFITLFSTAFLLLAFGCSKNPSEAVVSTSEVTSLPPTVQEGLVNKLPTQILLKGRIEFSDGTIYESDGEKLIDLPEYLWARLEESLTDGLGTDYYINYQQNFQLDGWVVFNVQNKQVNPCLSTWKHKISATLGAYSWGTSFELRHTVIDWKIPSLHSNSVGNFPSPPYPAGTYSTSFTNFSRVFDDDSDIDYLAAEVTTDGPTYIVISLLQGHLNGSQLACQ